MLVNILEYIRPLIAYRSDGAGRYPDGRFVGSCFFIDENGTAITCAHIIESLRDSEDLFIYDPESKENIKIDILWRHGKDDFAIICAPIKSKNFTLRKRDVFLGLNLESYGFLNGGLSGKNLRIDYRFMKGYISRVDSSPSAYRSVYVLETSFPSLSGFSGSPIFLENSQDKTIDVVGMLFGNIESSIEVFSFHDVCEGGNKMTESVNRILEFGLAHSVNAIIGYLNEYKKYESETGR